jgi:hypothetical protein
VLTCTACCSKAAASRGCAGVLVLAFYVTLHVTSHTPFWLGMVSVGQHWYRDVSKSSRKMPQGVWKSGSDTYSMLLGASSTPQPVRIDDDQCMYQVRPHACNTARLVGSTRASKLHRASCRQGKGVVDAQKSCQPLNLSRHLHHGDRLAAQLRVCLQQTRLDTTT